MAIKKIGKLIKDDNAINPPNLLLLYEYWRLNSIGSSDNIKRKIIKTKVVHKTPLIIPK